MDPAPAPAWLARLPREVDTAWVRALQERVATLPPKPLAVLLVADATKPEHEMRVASFFARAPLARVDRLVMHGRERMLPLASPRLRVVTLEEALAGRYDAVIGFDANATAVQAAAALERPLFFVGKLREPPRDLTPLEVRRIPGGVRTYTTHAGLRLGEPNPASGLSGTIADEHDDFFGPRRWTARGGIDFPPSIGEHWLASSTPAVPFVFLGGADRDYALVYEARRLLAGKVVVAQPDHGELPPRESQALAAMRGDAQFELLPPLEAGDYTRLLLNARIVLMPVHGEARGDYTSAADACWYGRPVLTRRVRATAHLGDRLLFFDDLRSLQARLDELASGDAWAAASARIQRAARERCDLYTLLEQLYRDL